MKTKKPVIRTCVITKEAKEKKELIRICANKEGVVKVDLTGKAPGRGAYLTLNKDVILKAQKTKVLNQRLRTTVPNEIYQQLLEIVKDA